MPPQRILNVAEKPSVARELAAVLSGTHPAYPPMHGSGDKKYFEFPYTMPGPQCTGPVTMLVTSVRGHLMEIQFDQKYNKWGSCNPFDLFDAPTVVRVSESLEGVAAHLSHLAKECNVVVLWLDGDREGEAIGFEVKAVCLRANQYLRFLRAKFSSVAAADIRHAIATLCEPDARQSEAVLAR